MADKITNSIATADDGVIQITFTIPGTIIKKEEETALAELSKNVAIAGFRKGKAPIEKVRAKIDPSELSQKTLNRVLPKAYTEAILEHKLRPATYPKFELISQTTANWQVRGTFAQIPEVEVGDYEKIIKGAAEPLKKKKEVTKEEKEQTILKALIDNIKVNIPKMLIDDEVNHRLSDLLARIEKLGLNLDNYLASVGKTPTSLREEYERQVKEGVSLELILNKIADERKVEIKDEDIEKAIKAANAPDTVEEKHLVRSILRRRAVLDQLITLM